MTLEDVRKAAFAMPLTSPSYPVGPYRFSDREYMIISYRTNREALERIAPEPLEFIEAVVRYEVHPDAEQHGLWHLRRIRGTLR
jgi:acetoacetate decarboxylase